jgi:hypothetical protein
MKRPTFCTRPRVYRLTPAGSSRSTIWGLADIEIIFAHEIEPAGGAHPEDGHPGRNSWEAAKKLTCARMWWRLSICCPILL